MKKVITMIAVLQVFLCNLLGTSVAVSEDPNLISNHVYAMLSVVTDVDSDKDLVSVTNWNGDVLQFTGVEDWYIGDYVNLVMHDNFTEDSIYDDIIIIATYERVDLVCQWFAPITI